MQKYFNCGKVIFFIIILYSTLNAYNFFIKGTHFFGNACPLNFWNSNEIIYTDFYLKKIKRDGFNTIILLIPYREFNLDKNCYKLLEYYFKKAKEYNLKIILRLSYFWDLIEAKTPLPQLFLQLAVNDKVLYNWLNYLKKIYVICSKYNNFLFGFLSWEDFWILLSPDILKQFPEFKKYFQLFLDYSNLNLLKFPERSSYKFKYFLKFFDFILMERIYKNAIKVFPKLSIEARVDYDPIFNNGKLKEWYIHKMTFNPLAFSITTVYYAPFMGQKNIGDVITCKTALKVFENLLKSFKNFSLNKELFIDQFNFISYVPNLKNNTQIAKNDLCCFILNSKKILERYTTGYSIWSYKYYKLNILYNSSFQKNLNKWKTKNVKIINLKGDKWLKLGKNSFISQKIGKISFNNYKNYDNFNLCFMAFSNKNNSKLKIKCNNYNYIFLIKKEKKEYCISFPEINKVPNIKFISINGQIFLDNIEFYNFIEKSGLYNLKNEKLFYSNCFVELNKQFKYIIKGIYSDNWMGKTCFIKIFSKHKKIKIKFYLPEYINKKVTITIYNNNKIIKNIKLKKGITITSINLFNGNELKLVSDFTFQPAKIFKNSTDRRFISTIIQEIEVSN